MPIDGGLPPAYTKGNPSVGDASVMGVKRAPPGRFDLFILKFPSGEMGTRLESSSSG